jgi:uncharacterized membrane protein YphA (DoxX/SURF4 family)
MNPYWPTVLRVALGLLFIRQGYCALITFPFTRPDAVLARDFPELAEYLRASLLGTIALGYAAAMVPIVGGLMMIVGFWPRWAAGVNGFTVGLLPLFYRFLRDALTGGRAASEWFVNPCPEGYLFSLLVVAASVVQIVVGAGVLSLTRRG